MFLIYQEKLLKCLHQKVQIFLGSTVHGRFRSFFTRTVVGKTANWDSQAIFQPPFRLGVGDSNWNSPQTINGCDACVCACVCIACTKV